MMRTNLRLNIIGSFLVTSHPTKIEPFASTGDRLGANEIFFKLIKDVLNHLRQETDPSLNQVIYGERDHL